jgi:hypothetical protein
MVFSKNGEVVIDYEKTDKHLAYSQGAVRRR